MPTLPHGYDPHLVAQHLGRETSFVTRDADYFFADGDGVESAIAAVVAGAPLPSPVPDSVPAHHIRRALSAAGLRANVESAIAALPEGHEMRDDWEYAPTIRRDSIGVEMLRAGLGLTHKQVDDVFRAAGAIVT